MDDNKRFLMLLFVELYTAALTHVCAKRKWPNAEVGKVV